MSEADPVKSAVAAHWNRRAANFDGDFGHSIATPAERAAWDRILDLIVAGQAHGAIAQGSGQALLERTVYDEASGQNIAASFMDYPLPRADELPRFDLGFNPTRCTTNPLGVKGCGEAGAVAALPAIHNAIIDALAPLGVADFTGPATPEAVWRAMRNGGKT